MKNRFILFIVVLSIFAVSCTHNSHKVKIRQVVDTVGFAKYDWQMDSIMKRLYIRKTLNNTWRVAITPHDDYAYVNNIYPKVLTGVKAKTIILFGVAHKARNFDLEDKLIFESFDAWSAPYGNVKISKLRNEIIQKLGDSLCIVNDEMHNVEHSLEALIPFLQYFNEDIEIVPILVPYMSFDKMNEIAKPFANFLSEKMKKENLRLGKEIAIVISTDAVHYGDEDWGGSNYAPYGTDSLGLVEAKNHEMEIITHCLLDEISPEKIQKFINYTVQKNNYKEYKWTWCGRYSVPFGLLFSYELNKELKGKELFGTFIDYSNSIDNQTLNVKDLNMGTTAPANDHHWVGYAAVGYE